MNIFSKRYSYKIRNYIVCYLPRIGYHLIGKFDLGLGLCCTITPMFVVGSETYCRPLPPVPTPVYYINKPILLFTMPFNKHTKKVTTSINKINGDASHYIILLFN